MPTIRTPEFRRALLRARRQLLRTVAATEEELAALEGRLPSELAEGASTKAAAAVLARLDEQERRELGDIEAALARVAAGTYGLCARCGGGIPVTRLRALPAADRCLTCAARAERGRRARGGPS
ncbi:MAG: TraR/DksA C4-type zinc finger protein [Candidatus Rokubacteria bacterium]|nr:TraR/DksA C4-type zinc finger protein [Candidatus Rokubacteria bacterium]